MGRHAPRHVRDRSGDPRLDRRGRRAWGAAALLTAVTALLVALALQGSATTVAAPGGGPPTSTAATPAGGPPAVVASGRSVRVVEREAPGLPAEKLRPEGLRIPSIGVTTTLVDLGLNDDRTVQVPQDAAVAGWYDRGPLPGEIGSAVVLGHVDSAAGPGVFARLGELVAGDRVEVRLSDGSLGTFRVDRVATYANQDFPAEQVYAGSPGRATLNLVTCGGVYDADQGGYQSNVVVFAERVGRAPAR